MSKELLALQDADFGWVHSLEGVWSDEGQTGGPNEDLVDALVAEFSKLTKSPNPPGRVFQGQAGIGKTHFVGGLRRRVWAAGGWFVMLDVIGITDFWKSAALSFVTSLLQEMPDGQRQYEAVIAGVARQFKVEKEVKIAFDSPTIEPKRIVDLLLGGLMKKDPSNALKHRDVFRALALLRSHDLETVGIAHAWLQGYDADEAMRKTLGFTTPPPTGIEIVRGLIWVMGLAGPILIAVDQIDGVLSTGGAQVGSEFGEGTTFAELLTGGLLDLSNVIGRGMIVMTLLNASWEVIKRTGPAPLLQRFRTPISLRLMQTEDYVRKLIADRLTPAYTKVGLFPRIPTDPFTEAAIASAATGMTPRSILMRCDDHRKLCASEGKVVPCTDLRGGIEGLDGGGDPGSCELDSALVAAKAAADLSGLMNDKDDGKLGKLLRDVIDLYAKQMPTHDAYDVVSKADPTKNTPPLHARLTFVDHGSDDREQHFCFRVLQHANSVALCARLRAALTASGISTKIAYRHLIAVRRGPLPSGPKTRELFDAFRRAGGIEIDPSDEDLRTFVALRSMQDQALAESRFDAFERWLIDQQPLCATAFFKAARLSPPPLPAGPELGSGVKGESPSSGESTAGFERHVAEDHVRPVDVETGPAYSSTQAPEKTAIGKTADPPVPPARVQQASSIPLGRRIAGGEAVELPIQNLPRHTAIIAGAGSGKTVLLRRIVEEAALAGIAAIVIDPNNDLSRLGDAWPAPPEGFTDEDLAKAKRYAETVEVVVWTPGIHAGNPLFLSVLPDFAAIGDDPDERSQAVSMAADTLGPLAGAKTNLQKGVLADALRRFAETGGDLKAMTALLADLPDGVSEIGDAEKIALKMSNELKAAVATNPLLKATGPVLDPKLLFFGVDPARTRISVVNLSGLASDEAKEDFVNRLQMALFGWIKKHPSPRGMLYVIDEAQIFIPSEKAALSKTSGVQLVAQARKYGLGMIAVTQAPKGIDNKVVSNCTTHFLGKQNAPATIQAAKGLIADAGGKAEDMGKLATGEFYFKTEKSGKPFKVRTPICLSWHPPNPPTPEDVVAKAKASRKG